MRFQLSALFVICGMLIAGCNSGPTAAQLQQQEQEHAAYLAQEQRLVDEKREQQQREEQQRVAYRAAIADALTAKKNAIAAPDIPQRIAALREIETSECPPDFRSAFVDFVYDLQQVNLIDVQKARLDSDENVDTVLVASLIATLNKSNDTPFSDALSEEAQLNKAREAWVQQLNEADRRLQRAAVAY